MSNDLEVINKAFSLADDPSYTIPNEVRGITKEFIENAAEEIRNVPGKRDFWKHKLKQATLRRAQPQRSLDQSRGGKRRRSRRSRRRGKHRH